MNTRLQVKEQLQRSISTLPAEEALAAMREILKERTSDYQVATRERDELIKGIQAENLALKGALRESFRFLQLCVGLLQNSAVQIPLEVAEHMGMIPRIQVGRRVR